MVRNLRLGLEIGLWIGIRLILKFYELNDDNDEPAARSIGGVALYAKATEPQEFGELKFGELKRNQLLRPVSKTFRLLLGTWLTSRIFKYKSKHRII